MSVPQNMSPALEETLTPDFRLLFESAPGLYLVLFPDFTIVAVSDAYLRATMTRREAITGRGIFDVFPDNPDDPSATGVSNLRASLTRVREQGVSDAMPVQKYDIRRPDAEGGGFEARYWSPVNCPVFGRDSSDLRYIIHRVEDVTELVRLKQVGAEQNRVTAEQAEDRARALMDSAPDAIVVTDNEGTIVLVNHRTETLLGYRRAELIGKPVEMLLPERFHAMHPVQRRAYAADPVLRPMGAHLELYARRADGVDLPVEISLSPVRVAGGLQIACAIRDITDRRRVLDELRDARNEADKANRAKGAFLATASHDLRQPVQALSLLNGVLRRLVKDGDAIDAVAQQGSAIDAMSRLLNALLDISKLESGAVKPQLTTWNAQTLLQLLRSEFSRVAADKGLKLEFDAGQGWVHTDDALVGQVLRNLVANAIKYTKQGRVLLRSVREGSKVRLEVHDTGMGMAPEELSRIYDEFYQVGVPANASRDGYGLGLSIVSRIVKLLGVKLDVRSEVSKGSVFTLELPAVEPSAASSAGADGGVATGATRPMTPRHVLLVEDDAGVRNATRLLLRSEGWQVATASSLGEAIRHAQGMSALHLIISDYHLGSDETGMQAVKAVREVHGQPIRAVIMSGDTSSAIKALGPEGNVHIVSKPIDSGELVRLVSRLLAD
jgi:PAS domain S-box-containing protein